LIKQFKEILYTYMEVTLLMQSTEAIINNRAFVVLDNLGQDIEHFHDTGQWGDAVIKQSLQLACEGLAKYYAVMWQSVYYVCLFLDLHIKATYVDTNCEVDCGAEGEEWLPESWCRYTNLGNERCSQAPPPSRPSVPFRAIVLSAPWNSALNSNSPLQTKSSFTENCPLGVKPFGKAAINAIRSFGGRTTAR
jgi:hypothetical protein